MLGNKVREKNIPRKIIAWFYRYFFDFLYLCSIIRIIISAIWHYRVIPMLFFCLWEVLALSILRS